MASGVCVTRWSRIVTWSAPVSAGGPARSVRRTGCRQLLAFDAGLPRDDDNCSTTASRYDRSARPTCHGARGSFSNDRRHLAILSGGVTNAWSTDWELRIRLACARQHPPQPPPRLFTNTLWHPQSTHLNTQIFSHGEMFDDSCDERRPGVWFLSTRGMGCGCRSGRPRG